MNTHNQLEVLQDRPPQFASACNNKNYQLQLQEHRFAPPTSQPVQSPKFRTKLSQQPPILEKIDYQINDETPPSLFPSSLLQELTQNRFSTQTPQPTEPTQTHLTYATLSHPQQLSHNRGAVSPGNFEKHLTKLNQSQHQSCQKDIEQPLQYLKKPAESMLRSKDIALPPKCSSCANHSPPEPEQIFKEKKLFPPNQAERKQFPNELAKSIQYQNHSTISQSPQHHMKSQHYFPEQSEFPLDLTTQSPLHSAQPKQSPKYLTQSISSQNSAEPVRLSKFLDSSNQLQQCTNLTKVQRQSPTESATRRQPQPIHATQQNHFLFQSQQNSKCPVGCGQLLQYPDHLLQSTTKRDELQHQQIYPMQQKQCSAEPTQFHEQTNPQELAQPNHEATKVQHYQKCSNEAAKVHPYHNQAKHFHQHETEQPNSAVKSGPTLIYQKSPPELNQELPQYQTRPIQCDQRANHSAQSATEPLQPEHCQNCPAEFFHLPQHQSIPEMCQQDLPKWAQVFMAQVQGSHNQSHQQVIERSNSPLEHPPTELYKKSHAELSQETPEYQTRSNQYSQHPKEQAQSINEPPRSEHCQNYPTEYSHLPQDLTKPKPFQAQYPTEYAQPLKELDDSHQRKKCTADMTPLQHFEKRPTQVQKLPMHCAHQQQRYSSEPVLPAQYEKEPIQTQQKQTRSVQPHPYPIESVENQTTPVESSLIYRISPAQAQLQLQTSHMPKETTENRMQQYHLPPQLRFPSSSSKQIEHLQSQLNAQTLSSQSLHFLSQQSRMRHPGLGDYPHQSRKQLLQSPTPHIAVVSEQNLQVTEGIPKFPPQQQLPSVQAKEQK